MRPQMQMGAGVATSPHSSFGCSCRGRCRFPEGGSGRDLAVSVGSVRDDFPRRFGRPLCGCSALRLRFHVRDPSALRPCSRFRGSFALLVGSLCGSFARRLQCRFADPGREALRFRPTNPETRRFRPRRVKLLGKWVRLSAFASASRFFLEGFCLCFFRLPSRRTFAALRGGNGWLARSVSGAPLSGHTSKVSRFGGAG
jgi:hypothetical protein